MFSQTSEYALRAVVCLAENEETPKTTGHIANITKVPQGYLSKVLQQLSRAGLVYSQRGLHGGFILSRPSDQIFVLDVINAVDPFKHIQTCPLGIESHGVNLCPLHKKMEDAIQMIEANFASCSIAELLKTPTKSRPLCEAV